MVILFPGVHRPVVMYHLFKIKYFLLVCELITWHNNMSTIDGSSTDHVPTSPEVNSDVVLTAVC